MAKRLKRPFQVAIFFWAHFSLAFAISDQVVGQLLDHITTNFDCINHSTDGSVIQIRVIDQCKIGMPKACAYFSFFHAQVLIRAFQASSFTQGTSILDEIFSVNKIKDSYQRWSEILLTMPKATAETFADGLGWGNRCYLLEHDQQLRSLSDNGELVHESSLLMQYQILYHVPDILNVWDLKTLSSSMASLKQETVGVRAFIMLDEWHAYCMVIVKYHGQFITFILDSINEKNRIEQDEQYINFFKQCMTTDDVQLLYLQECYRCLIEQSDIFMQHYGLEAWANNNLGRPIPNRQGVPAYLWYHTLELTDALHKKKAIKKFCPALLAWVKIKKEQFLEEYANEKPTEEFARLVALVE